MTTVLPGAVLSWPAATDRTLAALVRNVRELALRTLLSARDPEVVAQQWELARRGKTDHARLLAIEEELRHRELEPRRHRRQRALFQARRDPRVELGGGSREGLRPHGGDARVVGALLGDVTLQAPLRGRVGRQRQRRLEQLGGAALAVRLTAQQTIDRRESARVSLHSLALSPALSRERERGLRNAYASTEARFDGFATLAPLPAEAKYLFAADLSASALFVFSHVNSASSRPK